MGQRLQPPRGLSLRFSHCAFVRMVSFSILMYQLHFRNTLVTKIEQNILKSVNNQHLWECLNVTSLTKIPLECHDHPQLNDSSVEDFFRFVVLQKPYAFCGNHTSSRNFDLFLQYSTFSRCQTTPGQPHDHKSK